jgi:double-strand break repair protein MRE11
MISTDNHLGFMEKDGIRRDDSFLAFEEMLSIAKTEKVDMVLLGGDLFHDNKPSNHTLYRTMRLLRHYCMGDDAVALEFMVDPTAVFHDPEASNVNYLEPTHNISLPVFSIHGNHDDPTGQGNYAALDILSVAGMVNYFGKILDFKEVVVNPILLRKGKTHVAVYGLGNIRDERLHRLFIKGKVQFTRPSQNQEDFVNIFTLHQNRVAHGPKNYIPEGRLPKFMDLVVWGHEHQCRIDPEESNVADCHISQPGSTVATSLSEGESDHKHVAIMEICGKEWKMQPIRLKTVRPFVVDSIVLSRLNLEVDRSGRKGNQVKRAVEKKVDEMIAVAKQEWFDLNPHADEADCPLPLIRLKVDYTNHEDFAREGFGAQYVNKVANPGDVLLLQRKSKSMAKSRVDRGNVPSEPIEVDIPDNMQDFLLKSLVNLKLKVLPEEEMLDAIKAHVVKADKTAIEGCLTEVLDRTQRHAIAAMNTVRAEAEQPGALGDDDLVHLIEIEKQKQALEYAADPTRNRFAMAEGRVRFLYLFWW